MRNNEHNVVQKLQYCSTQYLQITHYDCVATAIGGGGGASVTEEFSAGWRSDHEATWFDRESHTTESERATFIQLLIKRIRRAAACQLQLLPFCPTLQHRIPPILFFNFRANPSHRAFTPPPPPPSSPTSLFHRFSSTHPPFPVLFSTPLHRHSAVSSFSLFRPSPPTRIPFSCSSPLLHPLPSHHSTYPYKHKPVRSILFPSPQSAMSRSIGMSTHNRPNPSSSLRPIPVFSDPYFHI